MNYRYYQITLRVKYFYRVRSVDWVFITGAPAWSWLREYVTLDKTFYNFLFKEKAVAAPNFWNVFFLIVFLEEAFTTNIIITLCISYIIILWINDNNVVINNHYGRLQNLIVLFQIPMSTQMYLFQIYRQFGHALSKSVASPAVYPNI